MSVFSWLFKSSSILQPDKQPKQVASLRKEIGQERETFNEVWRAHEAKTKLLNRLGSTNRKTILAKIDRSNEIIIDSLKRLISINKLEETLLKKILFESTHRLHETEGWLWKHGQSNPTALDQQTRSINTPEGRRQPYNIETKKRAVWAIVNDEKERNGFIQRAKKRLSGELERFKSVCKETMQLLKEQSKTIGSGETKKFNTSREDEDRLIISMRDKLGTIMNEIILLAQKETKIESDEVEIREGMVTKSGKKRPVGVMLIHGMTSAPGEMRPLSTYLRGKEGFITYVVRLPGHGRRLDEFALTPIAEIEQFLERAFRYFYEYMLSKNPQDPRFHVVGLSLGAMLPIRIMAKKSGKNHPFQNWVKSFVCMGACITPVELDAVEFNSPIARILSNTLVPLLEKKVLPMVVGGNLTKSRTGMGYNENAVFETMVQVKSEIFGPDTSKEDMGETTQRYMQEGVTKNPQFLSRLKIGLKPIIENQITQLIEQGTHPGELYIFTKNDPENRSDTERLGDKLIDLIIRNIKKGKRPLSSSDSRDIRALLTRHNFDGSAYRNTMALGNICAQLRKDLKQITIPILVIQGDLDNVTSPKCRELILRKVKSKFKSNLRLRRSGHIVTQDVERKKVFQSTLAFLIRVDKIEAERLQEDTAKFVGNGKLRKKAT